VQGVKDFVIDYIGRHKHPVNAVLHIFGVPLAFYGFGLLFFGQFLNALLCIFFGYVLQWLGHRAQGNEVGEVILIKKIYRRITGGKAVG
jgi:hypothetical protein